MLIALLHPEENDEASCREAAERILVARRDIETAQHHRREDRDDHHAEENAEFLARDGENEIGMAVGKNALHRLARPLAEPAAGNEAFHGRVDLNVSLAVTPPAPGSRNLSMRERTWAMWR